MQEKEIEIAKILLDEIKKASSEPETPNTCSARTRAISDYREFIAAVSVRSNII